MSLPVFSTQAELFSTAGLSSNLFSQTDRYRLFAQVVYPAVVASREKLEKCYCAENGRVAIEPVLMLGVSLLQYVDGLPDRQAVEMLRYHAGWNFALNRQLGDELFHPTTLVHFRQRLLEEQPSALGFQTILDALVETGRDTARLLEWGRHQPQDTFVPGPQLDLLERVFQEQFEIIEDQATPKAKGELSSERVQNPHDPEATYAVKGEGAKKKKHVGYKVQVAETVTQAELAPGEPTPNFINGMVTHAAHQSDEAGAEKMEAEQAAMGLEKPSVQYVDGAYVSAEKLAATQAEGRSLIGPAASAPHNNGGRYTTEDFQIEVEQRIAICPAAKQNTHCSRLEEQATGKVTYRFEWSTHCADCPLREHCVGPEQKHRTIVVGEHHSALQARRREQKTEAFAQQMKHRNGIEGTQSELVRAHGIRRSRYRGLAKARLQNYFAAAACNVKRWINRKVWELSQAQAQTSACRELKEEHGGSDARVDCHPRGADSESGCGSRSFFLQSL